MKQFVKLFNPSYQNDRYSSPNEILINIQDITSISKKQFTSTADEIAIKLRNGDHYTVLSHVNQDILNSIKELEKYEKIKTIELTE